jgi:proton-dependent oligopeptide transporter, POT family
MSTSAASVVTSNRYPPQIKYIVGNEACERFSYYGMRSILVIFMTKYLVMDAPDAKSTYHLFMSACYLLPLLGAFISDRYLGKYKTIIYLSIVYCLGHLVLSIWDDKVGMYWGLGLIALGSGGIKPCVSAHVGDQFNETNKHLLQKVFSLFYFSINFGAFFSSLLIPWVLPTYGPGVAFGIPGILMALATIVFWMGRKQYVHVPPTGKTGKAGFLPILSYSLRNLSKRKKGQAMMDVARERYSAEEVEGAKAALDVFKVFATVTVFWALFDQQGSTWVLQAEKMDRNFMGMTLEASQIQALNPIMVLVLIPIFELAIYPLINKLGFKLTPLRKMSMGMMLAAFSFVWIGVLQASMDAGNVVNVSGQFMPYLIITMSEVMVSITGLEFAYTQAPRTMKSTIMSFWLLTVFGGNLLAASVSKINVFTGAGEFYFYAALMFAVSIVFVISAIRYKVRNFIETSADAALNTAPQAG